MLHRKEIRIKSEEVDRAMYLFTNNPRPWPSYPADRIEVVLRHFGNIPPNFMYRTFDAVKEELVFVGPPELSDLPIQVLPSTLKPVIKLDVTINKKLLPP